MPRQTPAPEDERAPLAPALLLRPGRGDSLTLLSLWCVRQASRALLIAGVIPAVLAGQLDRDLATRLDSPSELLDALWSPLVVMAIAILLRLGSSITALAMAFPIRPADTFDETGILDRTRYMRWYDTMALAAGKRSLRWSWAVRRTAAHRLGSAGGTLEALGRLLAWCSPLALAALLLVVILVD